MFSDCSAGSSSRAQQGPWELNPTNPCSIINLVTQNSNHRKVHRRRDKIHVFSDWKVIARSRFGHSRSSWLAEGRKDDCGVHLKDFTLFGEAWGRNGFTLVGQWRFLFGAANGFRKLSTLLQVCKTRLNSVLGSSGDHLVFYRTRPIRTGKREQPYCSLSPTFYLCFHLKPKS